MEQIILEKNISRLRKEKQIIRSRQYGFTNKKSCFINLINFCDDMTSLVDEGGAVDIAFLKCSKALETVHLKILILLLIYGLWIYGLCEKTVRRIENRLNGLV